MADLDALRNQLEQLQARLDGGAGEAPGGGQAAAQAAPPSVKVVYSHRKLSNFDGDTAKLDDWTTEAKAAIRTQALGGEDAVDFLKTHLVGAAKNESRYAE